MYNKFLDRLNDFKEQQIGIDKSDIYILKNSFKNERELIIVFIPSYTFKFLQNYGAYDIIRLKKSESKKNSTKTSKYLHGHELKKNQPLNPWFSPDNKVQSSNMNFFFIGNLLYLLTMNFYKKLIKIIIFLILVQTCEIICNSS